MARRGKRDLPPVNLDFLDNIVGVQWGGHPFLLLEFGSKLGISQDGIQWTSIRAPASRLQHGAFGKSAFIVSNNSSTTAIFRGTQNGKTWTPVTSFPFANMTITDIVYGDEQFAVVGYIGTPSDSSDITVVLSEDQGKSWSVTTLPIVGPFTTPYRESNLSFTNGKWICNGIERTEGPDVNYRPVIGYDFVTNEPIYGGTETASGDSTRGVIYTSTDCRNWAGPIYPFPLSFSGGDGYVTITNPFPPFQSVTIPGTDPFPIPSLASPSSVQFVSHYGEENDIIAAINPTNTVSYSYAFSTDGGGWDVEQSPLRNANFGGHRTNKEGLFTTICTNLDGDAGWATATAGGSLSFRRMPDSQFFGVVAPPAWGKDKFVLCGGTQVLTSQDGQSWTSRGNPLGSLLYHRVVY